MITIRIIGVGGSQRKSGNTEELMKYVLDGAASKGAKVEEFHLVNLSCNNCTACDKCWDSDKCEEFNDDINKIYKKVMNADGFVLGAPTYVYNVPALMKTFLDRTYPLYGFSKEDRHKWWSHVPSGKKAVIFSVCEQPERKHIGLTLDAMRLPLMDLGFDILDELAAVNFFERKAVKRDSGLLEQFRLAGEHMANSISEYQS